LFVCACNTIFFVNWPIISKIAAAKAGCPKGFPKKNFWALMM